MQRIIGRVSTVCQPEKQDQRKHTPLMNKTGKLVAVDNEKAEILKNIFASVFTGSLSSHTSQAHGLPGRDWGAKSFPL